MQSPYVVEANSQPVGRRFVDILTGRSFDLRESAESSVAETVARRERIAGRELTDAELRRGLERIDNREIRQRIADEQWSPTLSAAEPDTRNAVRRMLEDGELPTGQTDKKLSAKQRYTKLADELDAKAAAAESQAAFDSDPRRLRATEIAEQQLEICLFSPDATYADVVKAKQRLESAKTGCLKAFKLLSDEFSAQQSEKQSARVASVDAELAKLQAQRAELIGEEFEPSEPPPEPATWAPSTYQPPPAGMRVLNEQETRELDARRQAAERKALP